MKVPSRPHGHADGLGEGGGFPILLITASSRMTFIYTRPRQTNGRISNLLGSFTRYMLRLEAVTINSYRQNGIMNKSRSGLTVMLIGNFREI
jgi:hypothetical protein